MRRAPATKSHDRAVTNRPNFHDAAANRAVSDESAKKPHADREFGSAKDFRAINRRVVCAEVKTITGWPLSEKRGKRAAALAVF